jgi:hypothetical protein
VCQPTRDLTCGDVTERDRPGTLTAGRRWSPKELAQAGIRVEGRAVLRADGSVLVLPLSALLRHPEAAPLGTGSLLLAVTAARFTANEASGDSTMRLVGILCCPACGGTFLQLPGEARQVLWVCSQCEDHSRQEVRQNYAQEEERGGVFEHDLVIEWLRTEAESRSL